MNSKVMKLLTYYSEYAKQRLARDKSLVPLTVVFIGPQHTNIKGYAFTNDAQKEATYDLVNKDAVAMQPDVVIAVADGNLRDPYTGIKIGDVIIARAFGPGVDITMLVPYKVSDENYVFEKTAVHGSREGETSYSWLTPWWGAGTIN